MSMIVVASANYPQSYFSHGPSLRGPWSTDGNSSPYNLTDPEYNPAAPQYNPTDPQYNLADLQPSN